MTDNEPAHSQSDGTPARREFGRRPVLALFAVGGGAALLSAVTDHPVAGLLASLLAPARPPDPCSRSGRTTAYS